MTFWEELKTYWRLRAYLEGMRHGNLPCTARKDWPGPWGAGGTDGYTRAAIKTEVAAGRTG